MTQFDNRSKAVRPPNARRWNRWDYLCVFVLLAAALLTPFALNAAITSWQDNNNDLISWADDKLPVKQQFQTFVDRFGRPELVVVSWPECRVEAPELQALTQRLEQHPGDWFVNIATAAKVMQKLEDLPGRVDESVMRSQLQGILLSPDAELACLVAELGVAGRSNRPLAIQKLRDVCVDCGLHADDLKIGGMGPELAALDFESVAAPARLAPITGLCMAVLCVWFLMSVILGLFVTTLGALAGILSAAIIHWSGVQSNAILATLPTLGGLLTISLSLHFIGYYRNARQELANPRAALVQAYQWAWKPTIISAVTTALGLGSLTLSRTLTIQQFGTFGAIVTGCAALLSLTVLPAFLRLADGRLVRGQEGKSRGRWESWSVLLQRRAWLAIAAVLIIFCILGSGLRKLRTGVHIDSLFVADHQIIRHDRWLEENIGPLSTLEVVASFPKYSGATKSHDGQPATQTNPAKDLQALQQLTIQLRQTNDFHALASLATGLPDFQQQGAARRFASTKRLQQWLTDNHTELLTSGFYAETEAERHWRVSIRIPTLTVEPTSRLRDKLVKHVDTWVADKAATTSTVEYFITGLPLLFEQIEAQFIEDLLITYIGGLVLISLTVLVVLRSVKDAAVAMIPNVLPAVGVLGSISLLGIELDVGSVMTASIALGVAVDDTLHFILWYQQQRRVGVDSSSAVRSSILHCGAPILQTSIICGTGLAVLGAAPFLPTARFGTLIALMLMVALIGDLLFLPAMLSVRKSRSPASAAGE